MNRRAMFNQRCAILFVSLAVTTIAAKSVSAADSLYQKDILPFLNKNCFACHGNGKDKGGVSFDKFTDDQSVWKDRSTWITVQQRVQAHEMPPKSHPEKPTQPEIDSALTAIRALFEKLDSAVKPGAGRVTIRRLNRTEYNNTIRDLVGVDFKPAADFPADDVGYGFDNIGDVLSVSPLLLEKYLAAAEAILDQAIVLLDPVQPTKTSFDTFRITSISKAGELGRLVSFEEGDYIIRCRVSGEQASGILRVAGKDIQAFQTTGAPQIVEARVRAEGATSRVAVALLNAPRTLNLHSIEIEGPFDAPPPSLPESHRRLMAHTAGPQPREAARQIVTRFATSAFRRPVTADEVEKCLALYDSQARSGHRFEEAVRAALYHVLISPHFLFRVELDPPGAAPGTQYAIGEYELASRLSYFLWNSMPDEQLFSLAERGQIRQNLEAQVRRMVQDPKASSFLQNFAEQWLTLRKLDFASPDPKLFPSYNEGLRDAMIRESLLFFEAMVREDRSILDLIDANFTFVNEELAKHYGITGVAGSEFMKVELRPERGGILTHASILTLTSNATRTSPVKRGKFVLEQILNTPPPPPPADVPAIEDQKQLSGTIRQIMEQHRANPGCASCHQRLDPLGFAFENFDAVGVWRDKEGSAAVDASGVLPDGKTFNGPVELKRILRQNKDLFVRCVVEKMLTYALGRGLEPFDRASVDKIVSAMDANGDKFSTLMLEIVKSDPFQMRTVPGEAK